MRACGTKPARRAAVATAMAIAAAGAWGCGAPREREAAHEEGSGGGEAVPAPETPGAAIFAVYEGTLPCADCGGIRTELTLLTDGSAYELVETYLAAKDGDHTFESSGTWSTTSGIPDDPAATVFELDAGDGSVRRYLLVSESEIRLLGRDGKPPESKLNYSLTKKIAPPAS